MTNRGAVDHARAARRCAAHKRAPSAEASTPSPVASRPLAERGEQQRAGPGAEIEDRRRAGVRRNARRAASISVSLSARGISAPGPTASSIVQKARRAGDIGDRLVREAALDQGGEASAAPASSRWRSSSCSRVTPERVRHQQFGIEPRGVGDAARARLPRSRGRASNSPRRLRERAGGGCMQALPVKAQAASAAPGPQPPAEAGVRRVWGTLRDSAIEARQPLGLVLARSARRSVRPCSPFEDFGQAVQGQVDAVIGHAPLREIIGADALRAVARADHRLARARPARSRAARARPRTAACAAPCSALALFLCCDFSSCWITTSPVGHMGDAHRANRWC